MQNTSQKNAVKPVRNSCSSWNALSGVKRSSALRNGLDACRRKRDRDQNESNRRGNCSPKADRRMPFERCWIRHSSMVPILRSSRRFRTTKTASGIPFAGRQKIGWTHAGGPSNWFSRPVTSAGWTQPTTRPPTEWPTMPLPHPFARRSMKRSSSPRRFLGRPNTPYGFSTKLSKDGNSMFIRGSSRTESGLWRICRILRFRFPARPEASGFYLKTRAPNCGRTASQILRLSVGWSQTA